MLGKALGEGTFGKVRKGSHILTGEQVAVKVLEKGRIKDSNDLDRISREIKILKRVKHPNIVQLYEIVENDDELYLIMEYWKGGELFDYIVAKQRIREREACRFYQDLLNAVDYLSRVFVWHRDLKPENILIDYESGKRLKIADFGLSNVYKNKQDTLKTACGSPWYAAPEMIAGNRYNGLSVDIWSSGVVLYAMIWGYLPFEDPVTSKLYKKIMKADYELPKWVSKPAAGILSRILETDPDQRATVSEIRDHPWFLQVKDDRLQNDLTDDFNQTVYEKLKGFGYDINYVKNCVSANKHNHATTTYYLTSKSLRMRMRK